MILKYGILAHPAGHSLSPAMFNAAFAEIGIDAKYEIFDIEPAKFEEFVNGILKNGSDETNYLSGISVSLPYKEKILEYLDEMSEDVKTIGACNTVKVENGKLIGFNTDWIGFLEALKEKVGSVDGLRVVVLGAGGAARAIVYGLVKENAEVVILNRTVEKAKKLAEEFSGIAEKTGENHHRLIQYGVLTDFGNFECDVLVQATSAGILDSSGDTGSAGLNFVSEEYLKKIGAKNAVVFDIVYKPLITPLLEVARDAGCEIITGEKMLLNQAVKQFEIWFREEAPVEVMERILVATTS